MHLFYRAAAATVLFAASGCSSVTAPSTVASYDTTTCSDLDNALSANAKRITQIAISRGTIARVDIPSWLGGASTAIARLNERRSTQIQELQQQQAAIKAARDQRCPVVG